jgi:hypothetical protein
VTRRAVVWALSLPLAAVGVLVGHALAYRLTAEAPGSLHGYLHHAPEIVAILATVGLGSLAVQQRTGRLAGPVPYALLGAAGFALQEHLERLAHTGDVPWLLTDPTFLVGLALQLPLALACLVLARRLLRSASGARARRPPVLPGVTLELTSFPAARPAGSVVPRATGRGPPASLRA